MSTDMMNGVPISFTRKRNNSGGSPFGMWLREHPDLDSRRIHLDIEDIDFIPFLYERGLLSLLEEKIGYLNFPTVAQADTHGVIDQALRFAFAHPDFMASRYFSGRPNKITYGGYHLVQFENTNPDDGGIHLNGMPISQEDFTSFLQGNYEPTIQYQHLCQYKKEVLRILECNTLTELGKAHEDILKGGVDTVKPEVELLRSVFREQCQKIKLFRRR